MIHRSSHSDLTRAWIELALLQRVLDVDRPYPWNPDAPEAQAYFTDLDTELDQMLDEVVGSDEEMAQRWEMLSQAVEASWAEDTELSQELSQQFSNRMPDALLDAIAQRAQQMVASGRPLVEQLVHCVHEILPEWNPDDLQVMARPLAYAMRGSEADMLEVALRSVRFAAWTELSGVEKARLSLAIARYALAQLDNPSPAGA